MGCWGDGVDLNHTILAGIPTATLQSMLAQAQQGYITLLTGGTPIEVTYTQGDGQKSVTYTKTNVANLVQLIQQLQIQLGITRGRRPMRPVFSGR